MPSVVRSGLFAGRDDRRIERVVDAGLEGGVEEGELHAPASTAGRPRRERRSATIVPSVSVPVLSVHRTSMLPRFSMASSRRTMTPRFAIARAPADKRHADDRRQQLGDSPTASATAKSSDSIDRPAEQHVDGQHEQHDDDHHPDQQIAELAHAPRELGFRRARLEPRGDGAERRARPVSTTSTVAVPLRTEVPRKTALVRPATVRRPARRRDVSRPGRTRR